MKTYTLSVDVTPAPTATPDDALALAVQPVDALTVITKSSARKVGGGIVNVKVTFLGLNDNEARETVRQAWESLRRSGGTLRSVDPVVLKGVNTDASAA